MPTLKNWTTGCGIKKEENKAITSDTPNNFLFKWVSPGNRDWIYTAARLHNSIIQSARLCAILVKHRHINERGKLFQPKLMTLQGTGLEATDSIGLWQLWDLHIAPACTAQAHAKSGKDYKPFSKLISKQIVV